MSSYQPTDREGHGLGYTVLLLEEALYVRTAERDAAAARADLAEQRVAAFCALLSDKNIVDQDGQCVTCWTDVEDPISPEPHGPNCLIVRLRAATQEDAGAGEPKART